MEDNDAPAHHGTSRNNLVERPIELTQDQLALLERVALGVYENAVSVPGTMSHLLGHGLVEQIPTILFPLMPSRHSYRITNHGRETLLQKTGKSI